jgi:hypothetical protein
LAIFKSTVFLTIASLVLPITGLFLGWEFQNMAYWVPGNMVWYWVGAALSYLFTLLTVPILILLTIKNHTQLFKIGYSLFTYACTILVFANLFLTSLIIIAGLSGM